MDEADDVSAAAAAPGAASTSYQQQPAAPTSTPMFDTQTEEPFLDAAGSDFELLKRVRVCRVRVRAWLAAWCTAAVCAVHTRAGWCPACQRTHALAAVLSSCRSQALLNERMAPDILQYRTELVQRIREGLSRKVCWCYCCCCCCCVCVCVWQREGGSLWLRRAFERCCLPPSCTHARRKRSC
jgi:hypothetical protein